MELSYSHRFVFVHVYRAGGQSVRAALDPYVHVPTSRFARVPVLRRVGHRGVAELRQRNHGHITAKELRDELPPEVFGGFLKFTFVRNPWDWQVSIYHYIRQRPDHPHHHFFNRFGSFEDYLDWRINTAGPEHQTDFVLDESGELLLDFVGRYESLDQDFAAVCERLGIDCSLPHRNRSAHRHYPEYYTAETEALVRDAYRADIDMFGYDFDVPMERPPIVRA